MEKRLFGTLKNGQEVDCYLLSDGESRCEIITYGAAILSLRPFGDVNVVGSFDTLEDYLQDDSNQGLIIGRVANRIGGAKFPLDGWEYRLNANDNGNCLHSGHGFRHKVWQVASYAENEITLTYTSPDMEDGFPGRLDATVTYRLAQGGLQISYKAIPYTPTPICLTNHAYFNLDGFGGTVKNHLVQIFANRYTEVDDWLIPNGQRPLVEGTPYDYTTLRPLAREDFIGVDHNMILTPTTFKSFGDSSLGLAAVVENNAMTMRVYTDQKGIQFYTGNFLGDGPAFAGGVPQVQHGGFCMETQTEPNCIQRGEGIYRKGEVYTHFTVYEFEKK